MYKYRKRDNQRNGAVVVEAAFVIPLVLLLTLATLDICDGIFMLKKTKIAAYEGARVAVGPFGTEESTRQAVANYLDSRGIRYDNIDNVVDITYRKIRDIDSLIDDAIAGVETTPEIISGNASNVEQLDPITVSVQIDLSSNRRLPLSPFQFIQGSSITSECTMLIEGE